MSKQNFQQHASESDQLTDNLAEELLQDISATDNDAADSVTADNTAEDELEQLRDAHLRLMAEYDNYRKRTIKEKADLIKNGGEKVLVGLLPVVDDFGRALDNIDKAKDLDAVKEGVDLIYQKFLSFLSQNGVKAMETIGQDFDDELFEAVATVPAASPNQQGKVIDDVQTGYTLNDKVIRHAKVVVAN